MAHQHLNISTSKIRLCLSQKTGHRVFPVIIIIQFKSGHYVWFPFWVLSTSSESWRFGNCSCYDVAHGFVLIAFWCRFSLTLVWTQGEFPSCPQSLLSLSTISQIFFLYVCTKALTVFFFTPSLGQGKWSRRGGPGEALIQVGSVIPWF